MFPSASTRLRATETAACVVAYLGNTELAGKLCGGMQKRSESDQICCLLAGTMMRLGPGAVVVSGVSEKRTAVQRACVKEYQSYSAGD